MLVSKSLWLAVWDSDCRRMAEPFYGDLVGVLDRPCRSFGGGEPRIAPVMAIEEIEPIFDT